MKSNQYERRAKSVINEVARETGLEKDMRQLDEPVAVWRRVGRGVLDILENAGRSTAGFAGYFITELLSDAHDPL